MNTFQKAFPVIALALPLIALSLLIDAVGSNADGRVVTEALIRLVFAVGLYIFSGNSGIISFGHMSFTAVAAYVCAWMTCCAMLKPITMSGLPNLLKDHSYSMATTGGTAILLSTALALVSGAILMRLSNLSASIATLALLFIVNTVYANWITVTMGNSTIVGLPVYVTTEIALSAAVAVIIVAYLFQRSRWGLMLRATREDEVAALASGVSSYWPRLVAFALSGSVAGLAGVLFAHFSGTVSISSFFLSHTFLIVAMIVVGGMKSLAGTVVGVSVLSVVIELFRRAEAGFEMGNMAVSIPPGSQELILAVSMLLILIFRKDGLMGGNEFRWPFRSDASVRGQKKHFKVSTNVAGSGPQTTKQ